MTYPDTLALDRWAPPTWDAVLRPVTGLWSWFEDPLERFMVMVLAVVSTCLLVVLVTQEEADVMSASDACVLTAVDEAREFAAVLGDDRPIPYSFARRACAQP